MDSVASHSPEPDVKRIFSALTLSAILIAIMVLDHLFGSTLGFYLGWGLLIAMALTEFYSMAVKGGFAPYIAVGTVLGVAVALAPIPEGITQLGHRTAGLVGAVAALGVAMFWDLKRRKEMRTARAPAMDWGMTLAGVCWIGLLGAYLTNVRMLYHGRQMWKAELLMVLFLLIAKSGDIAAYFAGRRFGRNKLAPSISPKKTREGSAAGLVTSVAVAGIGSFLLPSDVFLPIGRALLLGLGVGIAAQAGDLAESWYKRKMKAKDSSELLPHYGGILDVLDAVLFAMPTGYYLLLLLKT